MTIRDFIPSDKSFILATWLRGLYYGDTFWREINKSVFMKNYHAFLERFITSPTVRIRVACLKDDPEVVLGYAVLNTNLDAIHWVFTKAAWRKLGIAKALIPPTSTNVTHLTKVGKIIKDKYKLEFNPFLVGK